MDGGSMQSCSTFHISSASQSALTDREEITECFNGSLRTAAFVDDLMVENEYYFEREDTFSISNEAEAFTDSFDPVEEPWLLCTPASSGCATQDVSASRDLMDTDECLTSLSSERLESKPLSNTSLEHSGSFSDMHHPVEEPWLLFSSLESSETNNESESIDSITRTPVQYENTSLAHEEQQHQSSEELLPERDYNQLSFEDTVSTEILINSSVCTMQRIAVLEDGNLVELLLEPVKSNVQCGSVYLGVVTKLVPHMGGALVNIGSSRPSLMDIKHNREPFIFPPVGFDSKGKDISGFWSSTLNEYSGTKRVEQSPSDVSEVYPNDAEVEYSYMPDDLGDNEEEDDVDVDVEDLQVPNLVDEIDTSLDDTSSHLDGNVNASYMKSHSDQGDRKSKDVCSAECAWDKVRKSTKIIVQVVKEGLGTKGPTLTAYPKLKSRFWVLSTRCNTIGVSKKILGVERTRLRVIAKSLQPPDFGLTVRTVAVGRSIEELHKDLEGLLSTWRNIVEHAKSAALAAVEGVEGAVPVILHQAMGQTLSVVQDYFSEKVKRMVVDSPRTYHEVTSYLQEIAPNLCDRVELHSRKVPLFVEFNIEEEINNILNKRVPLPNGGSLVIEQTEALVSIDVNGGHGMFGEGNSQENAVLDVNLAAAKQIARELRLRDIGGIIVVDFIDMLDDSNKRLVYEEVKKAVERDRSMVKVSELSKHGLMEITRKRVRPSVTFMVSEPCACCHGTGRVEALETSFSKIEHEICRLLAMMDQKADPEKPKSWPRLILRVDRELSDYLTSGRRTRVATLSSSLKVWILLKVARSFTRGTFEVKVFQDDKLNNSVQAAEPQISTPINRTKLFPIKRWKTRRI